VSSILEALRELEDARGRPGGRKTTSVNDAPGTGARSHGAGIPLIGGLAVGIVVFGFFVWSSGLLEGSERPGAPAPPAGNVVIGAPAADPPPRGPAWLGEAEAPRARVTQGGPATPPLPARTASGSAPAGAATPRPTRENPKPAPRAVSSGPVRVESIAYSTDIDRRTATLRLNGRLVTLRQREAADGVEVQLIMRDGVYLQRGSDVYFVSPARR
jgi:hypothetical protein